MIDDRDCDIDLPCALDDHFIYDTGIVSSHSHATSHFLLTTIHVVRVISELLRWLQSQVIPPQALSIFDSYFESCRKVFPANFQCEHPQPLDPRRLAPILLLQSCKIMLHRHNFSTSCPPEVRAAALQSCLQVSRETVQLLDRAKKYEPAGEVSWKDAIASASTTMVCMHIWRCLLFLCFSALYDEALVCADICVAIGDFRQANINCGRNLYGFLRQLATKIAHSSDLMSDQMIIALVSGDIQGGTETAWIWNGSEIDSLLDQPEAAEAATTNGQTSNISGNKTTVATAYKSEIEEWTEWSDWQNIQEIIRQLRREKEQREYNTGTPHQIKSCPLHPLSRSNTHPLQALTTASSSRSTTAINAYPVMTNGTENNNNGRSSNAGSSSSRISIANII
jgi:hypothetical protein